MVKEIKSEKEFLKVIKEGNVVVDFYATWCGPCKMLEPITEEMSEKYSSIATFYKLNVDEVESVAANLSISSIPTVILYKDGNAANGFLGYREEKEFAKIIENTFNK